MTESEQKNRTRHSAEITDGIQYRAADAGDLNRKRFILKWSLVLTVLLFILIIELAEHIFGH